MSVKCPSEWDFSEIVIQRNILSVKCLFGEMVFSKMYCSPDKDHIGNNAKNKHSDIFLT
jgi:hypothetical protein